MIFIHLDNRKNKVDRTELILVAPFGYHAKVMDILTNADPTIRVGPAYSTKLNCINSVKGNRWPRCRPGSVPVEGRPVPSPESAAYRHPLRGFAATAAAPGVRHRHRRRHRTAPPLPPRSAAAAPIRRRRPAPPPPPPQFDGPDPPPPPPPPPSSAAAAPLRHCRCSAAPSPPSPQPP